MDAAIEDLTKQCAGCDSTQNIPATAPLHPWELPATPWQRIHVDFCGPFMNYMFLVVVDAFSKWAEVVCMTSTTAEQTVAALIYSNV